MNVGKPSHSEVGWTDGGFGLGFHGMDMENWVEFVDGVYDSVGETQVRLS